MWLHGAAHRCGSGHGRGGVLLVLHDAQRLLLVVRGVVVVGESIYVEYVCVCVVNIKVSLIWFNR